MPRRARLSLPGIPWHIIQRGNNRSACFFAGEDYCLYLDHLTELAERFECAVHAYVLMTNHVHLLLTPEKADGAALLMKHLAPPSGGRPECPFVGGTTIGVVPSSWLIWPPRVTRVCRYYCGPVGECPSNPDDYVVTRVVTEVVVWPGAEICPPTIPNPNP